MPVDDDFIIMLDLDKVRRLEVLSGIVQLEHELERLDRVISSELLLKHKGSDGGLNLSLLQYDRDNLSLRLEYSWRHFYSIYARKNT